MPTCGRPTARVANGAALDRIVGFGAAILCVVFAACQAARADETIKLIAHRGGVVEGDLAENTLPALEAAIDRSYWMIEVDVQESKDGHTVVHHDRDFRRFYGVPRPLAEMTWDEIRKLRTKPGGARPLDFGEFAAACRGRMRLMVDTKGPDHPEEFYQAMERALIENDLLRTAYFIGTAESKAYFKGKSRISVDREKLKAAIARGEDVGRLYFLFEHGRVLDEATVRLARKAGVPVVPSVNVFHYLGRDHMKAAEADIRRLLALEVTQYQIDSVYEKFCREE